MTKSTLNVNMRYDHLHSTAVLTPDENVYPLPHVCHSIKRKKREHIVPRPLDPYEKEYVKNWAKRQAKILKTSDSNAVLCCVMGECA